MTGRPGLGHGWWRGVAAAVLVLASGCGLEPQPEPDVLPPQDLPPSFDGQPDPATPSPRPRPG